MTDFVKTGRGGVVPAKGETESPVARPSMRDAEARAREIRGHGEYMPADTSPFDVDQSVIPDGWTYEWKVRTVMGAENPAHMVELARAGWEAVPLARHPEMMPVGHPGATIERDGCILMERPSMITAEVRAAEQRRARLQRQSKEEQLTQAAPGQFERDNKGSSMVRVNSKFEPTPIPE